MSPQAGKCYLLQSFILRNRQLRVGAGIGKPTFGPRKSIHYFLHKLSFSLSSQKEVLPTQQSLVKNQNRNSPGVTKKRCYYSLTLL